MSLIRRLRRRAWWLTAVFVLGLFRMTPVSLGRRLGGLLGRLALRVRPRERGRARDNLARALPELSAGERERLLAQSAGMLGRNFFDMLAAGRLVDDDAGFRTHPEEDHEFGEFGEQLADLWAQGRGLILLTGHIGSWELLGARVARLLAKAGCGPLAVVTGTVHNPPVDAMLQERRRKLGLLPLARREGLRPLLAHLRRGGVAALLLDQKLADDDPPVRFFGWPAPTPDGLVRLALKLGAPVLPVAMARDGSAGVHVISRLPVLNVPPREADEDPEAPDRVSALQQETQDALEEFVRRNPEQWVWFHERWSAKG